MATVLMCQAACEAMLADLFIKSGEDEKRTVEELGGNWERWKDSPMMYRLWILFKEGTVDDEVYKGVKAVRKIRNAVAHKGSPKTLEEQLKMPWLKPKKAEENAWKSLKYAVLLYEKIYFKYPAGPYREQWKENYKKQREKLEKEMFDL